MPGWIEKATTAWGRRPAVSEPQPYRLECACGGEVRGFREARPQQILCETCGEALFVLPVDLYPRPRTKPARRREKATAKPKTVREPRSTTVGPMLAERLRNARGALKASARSAGAQLKAGARRQMTPLRLVAAAMALVIAGTVWWAVRARGVEAAELSLRESLRLGEAALKEPDYPAAAEQFTIAAAALDRLGRDGEQARAIRQLARETSAMTHLAEGSLYEIAAEAEQNLRKSDQEWQDLFAFRYRGQWVVMETVLRRVENDAGEATVAVDYPLSFASRAVEVGFETDVFPELELPKEGRGVIFAAQLDGSWYDPQRGVWRFSLRPATAFLWSNGQTYRALGAVPEAAAAARAVESLLAEQSRLLGIADD